MHDDYIGLPAHIKAQFYRNVKFIFTAGFTLIVLQTLFSQYNRDLYYKLIMQEDTLKLYSLLHVITVM